MKLEGWRQISLNEVIQKGEIQLGRGNIISSIDIASYPGSYPIYSSSARGSGEFGRYSYFMFDEELITWSIDGGGKFFYRPRHKFSVTNVCGYMRVDISKWNPLFVYYLLDLQHENISFDYQTKAHPSVIKRLYYLIDISIKEQEQIAAILSTIDRAIAQTEAIIAKQQRIKTGLMQDLLTKGIDEHGNIRSEVTHKFKDSPLGRIPIEWEILSLSECANRVIVGLASSTTHAYRDNGIPLIRNQNIRRGYFEDREMLFLDPNFMASFPNKVTNRDDVLTVRTGSNVGDTTLVPEKYVNCPTFTTLITSTKKNILFPNYLVWYVASFLGQLELNRILVGAGKENLNVSQFVNFRVLLPTINEQHLIVKKLDSIQSIYEDEKNQLAKYKKVKNGLMQDLLTGKVRVTELLKEREPAI